MWCTIVCQNIPGLNFGGGGGGGGYFCPLHGLITIVIYTDVSHLSKSLILSVRKMFQTIERVPCCLSHANVLHPLTGCSF